MSPTGYSANFLKKGRMASEFFKAGGVSGGVKGTPIIGAEEAVCAAGAKVPAIKAQEAKADFRTKVSFDGIRRFTGSLLFD